MPRIRMLKAGAQLRRTQKLASSVSFSSVSDIVMACKMYWYNFIHCPVQLNVITVEEINKPLN